MSREWVDWHEGYAEGRSLALRLRLVQDLIRTALDGCRAGAIKIISMCAGDGRDLIGVLPNHPRGGDVEACLVELEPELLQRGREQALSAGLGGVEFRLGDASSTGIYAGAVPANIMLVCGVFGNISDDDIRRTIDHLPELCAPEATVIWTRGRFEPDLTPTVRRWFADSGFAELSFNPIPETTMSVGWQRLIAAPRAFRTDEDLFTFLPKEIRDRLHDPAATRDQPELPASDP